MSEDKTPTVDVSAASSNPSNGQDSTATSNQSAPGQETPDNADKRVKHAIAAVEKKNEEVRNLIEFQADLVRDNPEYISKLAEKDMSLADRVVEKVWGSDGVKSYKQLMKQVEMEQYKTSSPELYETNLKLSKIEEELAQRKSQDKAIAAQNFFNSKGIVPNDYDDNYKKVQESLKLVSPQVVENDYVKALELAYVLAQSAASPSHSSAPTIPSIGGGHNPSFLPPKQPQHSPDSMWLANSFGVKL